MPFNAKFRVRYGIFWSATLNKDMSNCTTTESLEDLSNLIKG
jgi:hypothetical protein